MAKLEERIEVKATRHGKGRYARAAERRGMSLSDWARRRLDEAAAEELGTDDEPAVPSAEDIAEALKAKGMLRGRGFRARVRKARGPWTE
jgi:hypothetical protein